MSTALKPCPFCGVELKAYSEAQGYWHPKGDCALADFYMLADGYSEIRWNRRLGFPDTKPSPAGILTTDLNRAGWTVTLSWLEGALRRLDLELKEKEK